MLKVPEEWDVKTEENSDKLAYEFETSENDRFDNLSHIYVLVKKIGELLNSKILGTIGTEFMLN